MKKWFDINFFSNTTTLQLSQRKSNFCIYALYFRVVDAWNDLPGSTVNFSRFQRFKITIIKRRLRIHCVNRALMSKLQTLVSLEPCLMCFLYLLLYKHAYFEIHFFLFLYFREPKHIDKVNHDFFCFVEMSNTSFNQVAFWANMPQHLASVNFKKQQSHIYCTHNLSSNILS